MTVKELIAVLETLDQDREICCLDASFDSVFERGTILEDCAVTEIKPWDFKGEAVYMICGEP